LYPFPPLLQRRGGVLIVEGAKLLQTFPSLFTFEERGYNALVLTFKFELGKDLL